MITELSEQRCFELLGTTTVGRLGFMHGGRVQIIPVNYLIDGRDVVVRTSPHGLLSRLPESDEVIAFEVDYHDDLAGSGWSVLLNGSISTMTDDEIDAVAGADRIRPWAGGERTLPLRFRALTASGRSVQRPRR